MADDGGKRKGGHRHLVYLIDGTWLWPGSGDALDVYSNIYRMNLLLSEEAADEKAQITYYARGLGGVNGIRKYTAGGFSYGIDELIADIYINLCANFERGDKIYVFGFSRGAVVARALSGLISKGILKPEHMNYFGHVWGDYTSSGHVSLPGLAVKRAKGVPIADYKEMCSEPNPEIEFLGVFDTVVGGHGISEVAQRLRLRERKVEHNVVNAVQLLAIDESRNFFQPVLWTGRKAAPGMGSGTPRHFEQMWMPGVHSDIGGAYSSRYLGDLSLVTMIDRVISKTKLRFNLPLVVREHNRRPDRTIRIHDELSGKWGFINPKPEARTVDSDNEQTIHPYALKLVGKLVNYKRFEKEIPYGLPNGFSDIASGVEFLSNNFDTMLWQ